MTVYVATAIRLLYRLKSHKVLLRRGTMLRYSTLFVVCILTLDIETVSHSSVYDNKSAFKILPVLVPLFLVNALCILELVYCRI